MSTLTDVTVSSTMGTSPLKNNYVKTSRRIIDQMKYFIFLHLLFGINRVYLLKYNKAVDVVCVLYAVFVSLGVLYLCSIYPGSHYLSFQLLKFGFIIVNFSLVILSLIKNKKPFKKFFVLLSEIDETLNIQNDLDKTSSLKGNILCFTVLILFSSAFHAFIIHGVIYDWYSLLVLQIPIFFVCCVIDLEQIFFVIPLKLIYTRICVIKAHVDRLCRTESDDEGDCHNRKNNDVELLARKSELDISQLHVLYQKLDKCSVLLTGGQSPSFILTFLISGAYTIIFLNRLLYILLQSTEIHDGAIMTTIDLTVRCFKGVLQIALPCYYCSRTAAEVTTMRTALHDYLNLNHSMHKIERRKLKAFYCLIKEFKFDVNIYGMFRLNMSLALSYISLCVTYLIIFVQFSKLIDGF